MWNSAEPVNLSSVTRVEANGMNRNRKNIGTEQLTEFERAVLAAVLYIPFGETRSYAWVAERVGRPKAVRAVGTALRKNRWPIVIPCHRVVHADGTPGRYAGRDDGRKAELIALERRLAALLGRAGMVSGASIKNVDIRRRAK